MTNFFQENWDDIHIVKFIWNYFQTLHQKHADRIRFLVIIYNFLRMNLKGYVTLESSPNMVPQHGYFQLSLFQKRMAIYAGLRTSVN